MAHFFGEIEGQRGAASRLGSKDSGLRVVAASWSGAIKVWLRHDRDGQDHYTVEQTQWQNGAGVNQLLATGVIGEPYDPLKVAGPTFTVQDVARALWMSDANKGGFLSKMRCLTASHYILATLLGLRAHIEDGVKVDLGDAGIITITHQKKPLAQLNQSK